MERPATILGGLSVIADVSFGKDADTPNGPGDYWAEVNQLWWRKRDGSKGKPVPQHLFDRAEKYDPSFCELTLRVSEELAYEDSVARHGENAYVTLGVL